MTAGFDPEQFKQAEARAYSAVAESYERFAPQTFGPFLPSLLEGLELQPGQSLLDVGAGTGAGALAAAAQVGPSGAVVGLDIAPGLIDKARAKAARQGLSWASFQVGDAEALPFGDDSFDRVLCNFGLVHFPDRPAALAQMLRVLKPGGRLACSVWSTPEQTAVIGAALAAVMTHHPQARVPGAPTWFDFGQPGALQDALSRAGFKQVKVEFMDHYFQVADLETYWQVATGVSGRLQLLLQNLPPGVAAKIEAQAKETVRRFRGPEGLSIPCGAWLGLARKAL